MRPKHGTGTSDDRSAAEMKVEVLDGWQHMVDGAGKGPGRDQRIAARFGLPLAEVRQLKHTRNLIAHPRRSPTPVDLSRAVETVRRARGRPVPPAGTTRGKRSPDPDTASADRGQAGPSTGSGGPRDGGRPGPRRGTGNRSGPGPQTLAKAWDEAHRMYAEREAQAARLAELRREQQVHDDDRHRRLQAARDPVHPENRRAVPRVGRAAGYPPRRRRVVVGVATGVLVALWLSLVHGWLWMAVAPVVALGVVAAGLLALRIVALVALAVAVVTAVVHLDQGSVPTGLYYLLGAVIALTAVAMTDY